MARANEIFSGETLTAADDRRDYGEARNITIGFLDDRMVVVVWTPRAGAFRIVSMRKANDREQALYGARFSTTTPLISPRPDGARNSRRPLFGAVARPSAHPRCRRPFASTPTSSKPFARKGAAGNRASTPPCGNGSGEAAPSEKGNCASCPYSARSICRTLHRSSKRQRRFAPNDRFEPIRATLGESWGRQAAGFGPQAGRS